ncbi:hypothetical protein COW81_02820 [Candidatus Campbellbacteria bacterium CG22_combo_CG10-13_8_21_14_all_36_13]|uniref:Uncharacterized protein n=1 Tax=Candidatus Campbellbacteria bacterium CG22_combo_CG10-13_8_21_14_all_36_13 TaxID=1974529 RepID=A0A2H0DZ14_9BACT|nr:MAG: hypothetical protein COW81_02820 [Candidatus Campbellbacteria bacterium CG22_combo_CG10-13_8_21_14_all_36_13]
MKLKFSKIKELIKKRNVKNVEKFGAPSRKEKDWKILVQTTLVALIAVSVWCIYLFYGVSYGTLFQKNDTFEATQSEFSQEELNVVAEQIQKQQLEFNRLIDR